MSGVAALSKQAERILVVETKLYIFVANSVITCITSLCIALSWQGFIRDDVCLGEMLSVLCCISHHLSSFPYMPRRSRIAWRIARHLCYVQGSKCPLFSPLRMIRLSLNVLRKYKPLGLLSDVLPHGKFKPQEIVMALNHCRQGLATVRFSNPC